MDLFEGLLIILKILYLVTIGKLPVLGKPKSKIKDKFENNVKGNRHTEYTNLR